MRMMIATMSVTSAIAFCTTLAAPQTSGGWRRDRPVARCERGGRAGFPSRPPARRPSWLMAGRVVCVRVLRDKPTLEPRISWCYVNAADGRQARPRVRHRQRLRPAVVRRNRRQTASGGFSSRSAARAWFLDAHAEGLGQERATAETSEAPDGGLAHSWIWLVSRCCGDGRYWARTSDPQLVELAEVTTGR